MPRPKQRTPELRAEVLTVAFAILDRDGVGGLTARGVASEAGTSVAAVYELFGDKAGLVREVFFEGFRQLGAELTTLPTTAAPRADLERLMLALRAFAQRHPVLWDVMFSQPFAAFEPSHEELAAGSVVREQVTARLQACIEAGLLQGRASDLAHVTLALAQGLARQETAGWLGRSARAAKRRWTLAVAVLFGDAAG